MSFGMLGMAGLGIYLGILVVVAVLARRARRDLSPADHFLAGRDLGVFVLFLTLYATAYSGNSLLGYPGEAYRRGFSWIMATGFMMSIIVVFHALVPKLRPLAVTHGFVTPGDWLRHRFGGEPGGTALRLDHPATDDGGQSDELRRSGNRCDRRRRPVYSRIRISLRR